LQGLSEVKDLLKRMCSEFSLQAALAYPEWKVFFEAKAFASQDQKKSEEPERKPDREGAGAGSRQGMKGSATWTPGMLM